MKYNITSIITVPSFGNITHQNSSIKLSWMLQNWHLGNCGTVSITFFTLQVGQEDQVYLVFTLSLQNGN